MSSGSRTAVAGLAFCAVMIGGGLVLGRIIDARRDRVVADEALRRTSDARLRAKDALDSQLSSLELIAQNAANNPRLLAALEGGVDHQTLRDIFRNESWWARYRDRFDSYAVANGVALTTIEGPPLPVSAGVALVQAARQSGGAASALVPASGPPYAAAASLIPLATRASPVLVVATRFDQRSLDAIAARAGGGVAISDGRQVLVLAGHRAERDLLIAAAALTNGTDTLVNLGVAGAETVGAQVIADGLWLLTHVGAGDLAERAFLKDQRRKKIMWAVDALLTLGLIGLLWRRHRKFRHTSQHGAAATSATATPGHPVSTALSGAGESPGRAQNLGRYVLLDQIGEGGMAQIFTAIKIATGGFRRTVVIKRLRPNLASNAEAVSQFIDEANLASQLVHSNIVPVFDFGKSGGQYYIAQEYIVGRDLGRVLTRLQEQGRTGVPLGALLFAAREILHALDYAHNKRSADGKPAGIVHRDVTPENIMVSARGEVKLLDFGIVKADEGRITKTQIGLVKGSIGYMSPEQARGREVDSRSDLFAVGLLIYTCHTGGSLYQGTTTYDLMVKAASGPGVPELERIAALPAPLPQILLQALAVNPGDRFQSAVEFAAALAPYVGAGGDELATLLNSLFDRELQVEERRGAAAGVAPGLDNFGAAGEPILAVDRQTLP